jgi:hypothetical protein
MDMHRTLLAALLLFALALFARTNAQMDEENTASGVLYIAWVVDGDLYVWREGDEARLIAEDNVAQPVFSPQGTRLAFARRSNNRPDSLLLINGDGSGEQLLVSLQGFRPTHDQIDQLEWLDEDTLIFSTMQPYGEGWVLNADLYRVNVRDGSFDTHFAPGQAGPFTISPDRQKLALVIQGSSGAHGSIRIFDSDNYHMTTLLMFDGARYVHEVFWSQDSDVIRVAVPSSEVVDMWNFPVKLWELAIGQSPRPLGEVTSSAFGTPQWSPDGTFTIFKQRVGDGLSFRLMVGDIFARNTTEYDGYINGDFEWLPQGNFFVYDTPNNYSLGSPDAPHHYLPWSTRVAGAGHYLVYSTRTQVGFIPTDDPQNFNTVAPITTYPSYLTAIYVQ